MSISDNNILNARILIVDDNQANVNLLEKILDHAGYSSVLSITDSRETLDFYKSFSPDLILLDINMPHLDGYQVMAQLRELECVDYLAILVITAQHDNETRLRSLREGAKDFLTKPFDQTETLVRIRNMLEVRLLHNQVKKQNKNLEQKRKEAVEANLAKTRFLSSMSHELRTPLNGILGFTDLLREQFFGNLNEKQLDYVNQIDDSGKHLLALINDLLDMAKIDANAMELHMEAISPEEFIEATVTMMLGQFKTKNINVETCIDPTLTAVTADIRKCKQIMLNLLSNALKYTNEGGRINIRAAKDRKSNARIEVSDTGIGIETDEIKKIFSEFHQADQVRDEQLGGTGIGLALARRLVEMHGGKIGVESQRKKGSTFWFTLPIKKLTEGEADTKDEKQNEVSPFSTGRRILVVEDNKVNLKMILDMLSVHNHKVTVANNGQEAIELAQSFKPELIFMDIRMPVMDGMEATKRLRAIPEFNDTPIIALTASTGSEAEERQISAGCTAHLSKPIQTEELFKVLEKYLKVKNENPTPEGPVLE